MASLRGELTIAHDWDLGARPVTHGGALVEASALTMGWLRLGAGYNFSTIGVGAVNCVEPTARGLFVRAEAVY